jgi:DNA-binding transcriptional LysR family regulator
MNLLHLKYAAEVAKTKSINQAAKNLYMNQPNLSRAIKELEDSLGISIFRRTSKGITITPQGDEFLVYARNILSQVDEIEAMYKSDKSIKQRFSICVPRATYISAAFTTFVKQVDQTKSVEFFYKETNSIRTIRSILQSDYRLGIVRYQQVFENQYETTFQEKGLASELIYEFNYCILMSKDNPLSHKKVLEYSDLEQSVEVAHGDPYVPSLPISEVKKEEFLDSIDKRIYIFERGSQFDLLQNVPNTFMWVSPLPREYLDKYNLIQIPCKSDQRIYRDILIYRKGYQLTDLDQLFLIEVRKAKSNR